ncbi:MAG: TolB family protein [Marinicellaceae bacterium]
MRIAVLMGFFVLTACSNENKQRYTLAGPKPPPMSQETKENTIAGNSLSFLSEINQLTFAGKRSGESYFSKDGSQLIFQSERLDDNPYYQIYKMDLEFGDVEMVSNGVGKTTCGWIHPDGKQILYASTHLDPQAQKKQQEELDFRASGKERRYSWDYDEHYDIFVKDDTQTRQVTKELGYDAEGSFSSDGQWIAFASNRNGFNEKAQYMRNEDKKIFAKDPSYMMDIYIMKSDGSDVKQLTSHLGYDGGPFFSPDNKKIVWRRFAANGATAEIFTMNIDGTEKKQITRSNSMSWAPFYHPSQKYIIYTTNINGFANFELYIVDAAGSQLPIRITDKEGFDGLPVFTPNGDELYWTRKKNNNDVSQIYRANWNHQAALKALNLN